jgi:hypothetical protein
MTTVKSAKNALIAASNSTTLFEDAIICHIIFVKINFDMINYQ